MGAEGGKKRELAVVRKNVTGGVGKWERGKNKGLKVVKKKKKESEFIKPKEIQNYSQDWARASTTAKKRGKIRGIRTP